MCASHRNWAMPCFIIGITRCAHTVASHCQTSQYSSPQLHTHLPHLLKMKKPCTSVLNRRNLKVNKPRQPHHQCSKKQSVVNNPPIRNVRNKAKISESTFRKKAFVVCCKLVKIYCARTCMLCACIFVIFFFQFWNLLAHRRSSTIISSRNKMKKKK